jgi:hypothetical protein
MGKKEFIKIILFFIFYPIFTFASTTSLTSFKLPYQRPLNFTIVQGYFGDGVSDPRFITHLAGKKDQYAIDFTLNGCDAYGKKALAADTGTVKTIKTSYYSGGYGNMVDILGDDGIVSRYAHLIDNSIPLKENDHVVVGQVIGEIGNTGLVSGTACQEYPGTHLHFAMYQKQPDGTLTAYKPEPISGYSNLLAGNWYTSDNELYEPKQYAGQGESSQYTSQSGGGSLQEEPHSFLSRVIEAIGNFSNSVISTAREAFANMFGGNSGEKIVETIDVNSSAKNASVVAPPSSDAPGIEVPEKSTQAPPATVNTQTDTTTNTIKPKETDVIADKEQEKVVETQEKTTEPQKEDKKIEPLAPVVASKTCTFTTSQSPSRSGVIINEVAWMGGPESAGLTANDEWIELKNISGGEVDVSNWQLIDKDEQIKINLGSINKTKVPGGGFVLLERTNDNSVPNIPADLIYSGALSNTNEGLRLFDSQCNLIDEVLALPDWPAGAADSRRTMERETNLSWHTYGGNGTNGIFGTPKQENGPALVTYTGGGGGGGATNSTNNQQRTTNNSQPAKILISEIQTFPTENRFIELYNPNNFSIDLTNWYIQRKTQSGTSFGSLVSKTHFEGKTVNANSYFLISRNALNSADIVLSDLTLTESNVVQLKNSNGEVVDKVGWGSASDCENSCAPELSTGQSIQRKFQNNTFIDTDNNANDFEIQSCPSPKAQSRTCESASVNQTPSVLLPLKITEVVYDIKGTDGTEEPDEGKELVVISNPNVEEVDVSNYSLQYLNSGGDFTKIERKNFEAGNKIPTEGIFKIGMNCHPDANPPAPCENVDLSWSQELNNTSGTVFLVSNQELLTGLSDPDIIDGFHYPIVSQLAAPSSFEASYDPNKLEINLSWVGNDSLVYQIQEYDSPGVTVFEGKGNSFTKRIDEVGRSYKFSIRAFNENAEHTELIEKEITVSSFINDVHLYRAEHYSFYGKRTDNLLEFSYDKYPFLPRDLNLALAYGEPPGPNYKVVVFYLNEDAPKRLYLDNAIPLAEDRANVLRLGYKTCAGSVANPTALSLILPDEPAQCNINIGGFANGALDYPTYLAEGDLHLLLPVASPDPNGVIFDPGSSNYTTVPLAAGDYITAAFYGFRRNFPQGTNPANLEGGVWSNFGLLAVDKTPYYFGQPPSHQPPQLNGEITLSFDKQNSRLNISWPQASDADTLDSLLGYEIKYSESENWQSLNGNATSASRFVTAGDQFSISVRAKDEFGNYSPALTALWSYPPTTFYIIQTVTDAWGKSFGEKNGYGSVGVSLQSFMPATNFQFNNVVLKIKHTFGSDEANFKLSIYPNDAITNQSDFNNQIAGTVVSGVSNIPENQDLTFSFNSPISVTANNEYWLALEVENYSWYSGWERNEWQNALATGNLYSDGEAGIILKYSNNTYSSFSANPNADWYMKIGLEQ